MKLLETVETLKGWIWSCETSEQLLTLKGFIDKLITVSMFPDKTDDILEAEIWELKNQIDYKNNSLTATSDTTS